MKLMCSSILISLLIGLAACGPSDYDRRTSSPSIPSIRPEDPYQVRARQSFILSIEEGEFRLVPKASGSVPVSSTVAANVKFTLSTANFVLPVNPEDALESYGTLDLTQLRDNKLDVCGISGTSQCSTAVVQVYIQGPATGLEHATKTISLPIYTGVSQLGTGQAGAVAVASTGVSTKNVLKLNHLTGGGSLQIPISVDFAEAAAGNYLATIVVEYVLQ